MGIDIILAGKFSIKNVNSNIECSFGTRPVEAYGEANRRTERLRSQMAEVQGRILTQAPVLRALREDCNSGRSQRAASRR